MCACKRVQGHCYCASDTEVMVKHMENGKVN